MEQACYVRFTHNSCGHTISHAVGRGKQASEGISPPVAPNISPQVLAAAGERRPCSVNQHAGNPNSGNYGDGFNGVTVTGPLLFNERVRIGASALKYKVPAMTVVAEMVPDGLLLSYGQDIPDFFRRSAACIDKILKGAKPADLPVEQPTHFKL